MSEIKKPNNLIKPPRSLKPVFRTLEEQTKNWPPGAVPPNSMVVPPDLLKPPTTPKKTLPSLGITTNS